MSVASRILQFIENKGISKRKFDEKISQSDGYIGKQIRNDASIGSEVLEKICNLFPELNPTWLLTGKGHMMQEEEANSRKLIKELNKDLDERAKIIQLQFESLEHKSAEIEKLKLSLEDRKAEA